MKRSKKKSYRKYFLEKSVLTSFLFKQKFGKRDFFPKMHHGTKKILNPWFRVKMTALLLSVVQKVK
jgi:hypothetical protein